MPPLTGKQRAARIPLDYFRHPDRLRRLKAGLSVLALLISSGWLVAGLFHRNGGTTRWSTGPVASVHAAWEADCAACHVPFEPMGRQVGMSAWVGNPHASDALCQSCHQGPAHSSLQIDAEVRACADCHRDHQGRDARLARVADHECTRCHASLPSHLKPGLQASFGNAAAFRKGSHPEFRPQPTSGLHFSHRVHMTPGMVRDPEGAPFTLAMIQDEAQRDRYRLPGQADSAAVALDCGSCHQLDASGFGVSAVSGLPSEIALPPRAPGKYMLPIVYENQCQACHPLSLERTGPEDATLRALAVPHRLQPERIHQELTADLSTRWFAGKLLENQAGVPPRQVPGKAPAPFFPPPEGAREAVAEQVFNAEKLLYLNQFGCGECHAYDGLNTANWAETLRPGQSPRFKIAPTKVPDIYLPHAVFNHAAHRGMECRDCHSGAYAILPDGQPAPHASTRAADSLLPGIDNCVQCHAPAGFKEGRKVGGARFDCAECHRYHNGDHPLQGVGAPARAAGVRRTIEQFLRPRR